MIERGGIKMTTAPKQAFGHFLEDNAQSRKIVGIGASMKEKSASQCPTFKPSIANKMLAALELVWDKDAVMAS